ncbi:UvrB/UvrC motif-containing protein, partial [candidate division WOR-3 bacterium]|nr:UvrB/UvrC motif-containing protein [candidate division WOR-3 bacterium]
MSTTEILQKLLQKRSARDEQVICSVCFLSLAEFKRTGRFGCSQCVTTFEPHIKNLIKQIQQSDRHVGRRAGFGEKRGFEVFRLREELKKALDQEAYEDAAKIRDKLKGYGIDHDE